MRTGYIYDIECLGNTHTATFLDIVTKEVKVFIINHLQDDRKEYFDFLFWCIKNAAYLGFNNVGYDYPVLHKIMQQRAKLEQLNANDCAIAIKKISDEVITSEYANIREKDVMIPQVDLYLVYHYNNKNKSCSLKMLEYVMRMENIEEMPFHHTYFLQTQNELNLLVDYNIHDVNATYKFYTYSKDYLDMRRTLSNIFGFNFTNFNDPKIGEQIFLHKLSEELNIAKNEIKNRREDVSVIDFQSIIIPELTFETKPYQALLNFYKKLKPTVEEIKGMLTDYNIAKSEISELLPYLDNSVIKVKKIKGKKTKVATKVSVLNGSISIDYGSGGAHGVGKSRTIWKKENGYTCLDIDVKVSAS